MNIKNILLSITKSNDFLTKININYRFINNHVLKPNTDFNKVCLNKESKYEEIYLSGLEKQYYNIILKDFSYFQFNFVEEEDKDSGYTNPYARYAFYPNPFENFNSSIQEIYTWFNEGDINFEDYSQSMSEAKPLIKRVPVRYDLSCKQYVRIYHPTAHFHFGMAENSRIATDKIFTPLTFTIFIINMYYIDHLKSNSNEYFILENEVKKTLEMDMKIKELNTTDSKYFCDLQDKLFGIR